MLKWEFLASVAKHVALYDQFSQNIIAQLGADYINIKFASESRAYIHIRTFFFTKLDFKSCFKSGLILLLLTQRIIPSMRFFIFILARYSIKHRFYRKIANSVLFSNHPTSSRFALQNMKRILLIKNRDTRIRIVAALLLYFLFLRE